MDSGAVSWNDQFRALLHALPDAARGGWWHAAHSASINHDVILSQVPRIALPGRRGRRAGHYQARLQAARRRRVVPLWASMTRAVADRRPTRLGSEARQQLLELARQAHAESSGRPHAIFLDLSLREKADLIQDLGVELLPEEIRPQLLADVDAFWRALGEGA